MYILRTSCGDYTRIERQLDRLFSAESAEIRLGTMLTAKPDITVRYDRPPADGRAR